MSGEARVDGVLRQALAQLRAGRLREAYAALEAAIGSGQDAPQLFALAGIVAARREDFVAAIPYLQRASEAMPHDPAMRANLARALIAAGRPAEAAEACATDMGDPRLMRLRAYALQQIGAPAAAADLYRAVLAAHRHDFESWNNLGNCLSALGDTAAAVAAFENGVAANPDAGPLYRNLSEALARSGLSERRVDVLRRAVARFPRDPSMLLELGLALADAGRADEAEQALRNVIAGAPGDPAAYVELAILLERHNDIAGLASLMAAADAAGVPADKLHYPKALMLMRRGDTGAALEHARASGDEIAAMRRCDVLARLHDRRGEWRQAFGFFLDRNRHIAAAHPRAAEQAASYRQEIEAIAGIGPPPEAAPPRVTGQAAGPVFLVGFPRSGTTLLDTMLMRHPGLAVFEEMPILDAAEAQLGDPPWRREPARQDLDRARAAYFQAARQSKPDLQNRIIIDKSPFNAARLPIIRRLFPDARVIFMQRHPYDAVLSAFMANFAWNRATANCLTIEDTATLYDAILRCWSRAVAMLDVTPHVVRYESLVGDPEPVLRRLLDHLCVDWVADVLDHRPAAHGRGMIATASYAQIQEALHGRSVGKWRRYAFAFEAAEEKLDPWVGALDYSTE
ncbi:tetratricopeptide repeat-containing sulfotransferase family protein [Stakelama saccharophila]|uniref:Sulfotransferase n=1 Tax=Stakelama saccharophila TaxID=3075605 RepID=A0ABZ0BBM0_9SPHN|nr:sulfotransferase [Stakelama sp. W311]WNO54678.1 sulfotransferase [Stakelama sp. W311]